MLTSLPLQGRALPPAVRNIPPAKNSAFTGQGAASASTNPGDSFVKRSALGPCFSGQNSKIGHANEVMDPQGNTWLHYAALAGDLPVARQLLRHSGIDFTKTNKQGLTAYTACATSGQAKIAELYRDHGAKLQAFTKKDAHGNVDPSQDIIHPSDLAKKYSGDIDTIQFFLNEEKKALEEILSKK
jgi:hypothetical protein